MSDDIPLIETLQQRISDLEQENAALRQQAESYQRVIDVLPQTIFWKNCDLIYQGCSARFAMFAGFDTPAGVVGKSDYELAWKKEESDAFRADDREVITSKRPKLHIIEPQRQADGTETWVETSKMPLFAADGELIGVVGTYEDITERIRAEEQRVREQEAIIAAQQAVLMELSTPLIPLAEGVIVMPLVGAIDSRRAQQIMETLLEGIAAYQAETAILDITGVRVVDTQVANALVHAAQAVKLLGAQVVLTGISPEVAQTIVHLGANLTTLVTRRNLQHGIAYALEQR